MTNDTDTDTAASDSPAGDTIRIAYSPCPNDTFVF
ncbi:1,4-dihydroxy-6-naphthoate synthase, partial [Streptomyces sp. SID7982]|nr:1,4-dihydroxy-6-naphthoate synthase [Streptomyces sp. SID7982]